MTTETIEQPQALDRYTPQGPQQGYSTATGESVALATVDLSMHDSTYAGMSERPVTDAQAAILNKALPDEDIDIRPDGAIFMSHARLRRRLNEAFKPGGWALRRLTPVQASEASDKQNKVDLILSAEYGLYAEGRFLSAARGEQKYQDNGEMTYGDAVEGLKSNALSRCCKDLGIALDLWDRQFADNWRERHCVKVWREGSRKPQWRRADALPFYDETGVANDSPNQDRYVAPTGRRNAPPQSTSSVGATPQRAPFNKNAPNSGHYQDGGPPAQTQPPRDREPGEDDEPAQPPAREETRRPSNGGNGRKISDPQCKRLYVKATTVGGMTKDQYRDFIRRWGYDTDRDVLMSDYDQMVAEAEAGGR